MLITIYLYEMLVQSLVEISAFSPYNGIRWHSACEAKPKTYQHQLIHKRYRFIDRASCQDGDDRNLHTDLLYILL